MVTARVAACALEHHGERFLGQYQDAARDTIKRCSFEAYLLPAFQDIEPKDLETRDKGDSKSYGRFSWV